MRQREQRERDQQLRIEELERLLAEKEEVLRKLSPNWTLNSEAFNILPRGDTDQNGGREDEPPDDVRVLQDEVKRLRAENRMLRAGASGTADALMAEAQELLQEQEREQEQKLVRLSLALLVEHRFQSSQWELQENIMQKQYRQLLKARDTNPKNAELFAKVTYLRAFVEHMEQVFQRDNLDPHKKEAASSGHTIADFEIDPWFAMADMVTLAKSVTIRDVAILAGDHILAEYGEDLSITANWLMDLAAQGQRLDERIGDHLSDAFVAAFPDAPTGPRKGRVIIKRINDRWAERTTGSRGRATYARLKQLASTPPKSLTGGEEGFG